MCKRHLFNTCIKLRLVRGEDFMNMSSKKILSMNLKFYREKYKLSQEKFAEKVGSNLVYINQLENCKRKPSTDLLDKIADGMNKNIDPNLNMTGSELIRYNKDHKTNFNRIDERKKK